MPDQQVVLTAVYRASGVTSHDFRRRHLGELAPATALLPGLVGYDSLLAVATEAPYPIIAPPTPDAFDIWTFESTEAWAATRNTAPWRTMLDQADGLAGYLEPHEVERTAWLPDPGPDQTSDCAIIMCPVYPWTGTSKTQFRRHYTDKHAVLGKRQVGIVWYESHFLAADEPEWPRVGTPRPACWTIECFESHDAVAANQASTLFQQEILPDCDGLTTHAPFAVVERVRIL